MRWLGPLLKEVNGFEILCLEACHFSVTERFSGSVASPFVLGIARVMLCP